MSVFTYELKKIMLFQKGLLYIIALLLISTLWLVVSDTPQDSAMEQYRNEYEWYLEKLEGVCTDETAKFLEQEAAAIAEANSTRRDLLEQYYSGEITEKQYEQKIANLDIVTEHENGFEVVYQQYLYVCENKSNHYFVYTNGWSGLFNNKTLDFPLFLVVLLLATAVFCGEYSCQMDCMILTSKEGLKSARYKVLILVGVVCLLCAFSGIFRYCFYAVKYGLPCGDYPIQSIAAFGTSTKNISLLEGYMLVTFLQCFGYVYFSILILLISVLMQKYALTALLGATITLIPYIGLSATVLCRLPISTAFMNSMNYISGSVYSGYTQTDEAAVTFREISNQELIALLTASLALCLIFLCILMKRNRNHCQSPCKHRKQYRAVPFVLMMIFLFSGCSIKDEAGNEHSNSASVSGHWEEYEVVENDVDNTLYLKNINTGELFDLIRSPLFGGFSEKDVVMSYYVDLPYVYYTTSQTESHVNRVGVHHSSTTHVAVVALDIRDFTEQIIFEQVTDSKRSLLGIEYEAGDKWAFLNHHYELYVNETSLFFADIYGVTEVDRQSNQIQKLDIPTFGNLAFDGQSFYYTDSQLVLNKYNTQTRSAVPVEEIAAYDFCMDDKSIYYISMTDGYRVYQYALNGTEHKMIYDIPAWMVSCDKTKVYITSREGMEQVVIEK